jgi:flagellar hook protein FlgE
MMRSLFAGVSGLRNHQVRMDVIGNNIANVNTVAFKAGRVTFKEAFAQLVMGASRPPGNAADVAGGTNPVQVGLGMNIGSIDLLFTQGNLETTGVTTDVAIQGDSFFVASDGQQRFYTRSGNFQLDANGHLVASTNGFKIQGKMATDGVLTDTITDIKLPFGQKSAAKATENVSIGGNLKADGVIADPAAVPPVAGENRETSITVYDEQGGEHDMTISFEKTAANEWTYTITVTGSDVDDTNPVTGTATFADDGTLTDPVGPVAVAFTPTGFGAQQTINVDFGAAGTIDGISQFAGASTAVLREQDGYTMGLLERISIDPTGTIMGAFTNGTTLTLAQIVLADFNNPSGLIRSGDNMYTVSPNSGPAVFGFAGEGSQSLLTSGALEMSNVDLAAEFTSMITAQRGFQSNARVISTSDEMMQELVNIKR